jgi:hypothetical protein
MALALVGSAPPQDSARAVALVQPSHGIALLPAPDARHQSACPVSRKKAARRRRHSNGLLVHALTVGLRWRQRQHLRRGSSGVDEDAGGDATAYALDGRSCRPRFSSSSTRPTRSSDRRRLSQLRSRNSTWHSNPCACPPSPDHPPPLQRGRVSFIHRRNHQKSFQLNNWAAHACFALSYSGSHDVVTMRMHMRMHKCRAGAHIWLSYEKNSIIIVQTSHHTRHKSMILRPMMITKGRDITGVNITAYA